MGAPANCAAGQWLNNRVGRFALTRREAVAGWTGNPPMTSGGSVTIYEGANLDRQTWGAAVRNAFAPPPWPVRPTHIHGLDWSPPAASPNRKSIADFAILIAVFHT